MWCVCGGGWGGVGWGSGFVCVCVWGGGCKEHFGCAFLVKFPVLHNIIFSEMVFSLTCKSV